MSEQNLSTPSATSGTSDLSELKEHCAELQRQTHSLRVALLVVAICVAGFLALEGRRNGQALQLLRPQAAQVTEASKVQDPIANKFLAQLMDFAKGHQDFGAVLGIFFLKTKLLAESGQNIPTSCVPNPTCNILFFNAGAFKDGAGVAGGKGGNFRGK